MGQTWQTPAKHLVRQTRNPTNAYRHKSEVDWLIHMDVDEFLWPGISVGDILAALPDHIYCARPRPRPIEAD